jgi:hypothetical protein
MNHHDDCARLELVSPLEDDEFDIGQVLAAEAGAHNAGASRRFRIHLANLDRQQATALAALIGWLRDQNASVDWIRGREELPSDSDTLLWRDDGWWAANADPR